MTREVAVRVKTRFIGLDGIEDHKFREGMTLEEMALAVPSLPASFFADDGVICINTQVIPRSWWKHIRPKLSEEKTLVVVTFNVRPHGQGRTAGILTTIAGVALTAAGIWFNQPWLISLGIGVTLSGVGMLLAPPPPQPKDSGDGRTLQAGISGNPPAPFEWLPRVLGRMVFSPPMLIRPYSVYSRGSITIGGAAGLVGRHAVSNIRINGALASSMSNVTTQTKTGAPGDTALTVGNKWVWEETANYKLSNFDLKTDSSQRDELFDQTTPANSYPQNQIFLTRSGEYADKAVIRLLFPQGMSADTEDNVAAAIPVRVLFRRRGSSTWILGPELHFWDENKGKAELRQNITFRWQADTTGRLASPYVDRIGYVAYQRASTSGLSGFYEANAYFSNGSSRYAYHVGRDDDGYYIYLDPAVFPKDHYEIAIKRGLAYRTGLFTTSTYAYQGDTTKGNFFGHYISGGVSKVRVDHEFKIRAEVSVEVFQTWRDEYPLQDALDGGVPLTLIGFEGRDLRIESVAAQFDSEVPVWNGTDWNTTAATARPAALYRHVLLDDLNADPRAAEIVNSGVLEDWFDRNVAEDHECNAIASANEPEILAMIASAGWAGQRSHEKWEVIQERDTSSFNITQLFTPLNSSNYVASKAFEDLPHALNVEFADQDNDNNLKSVIVPAPGYTAASATRFTTLNLPGFTDENKAVARATNLLRTIYYRQTVRQIDVGVEALVSQRGDIVGLAHDLKDEHIWFGTVRQVLDNGTNVTGIVINGTALLSQALPPFGAAIRYATGQVVIKPIIASGDSDTLVFTTPFAIPASDALRKGCLVSVGVLNEEARRCRITNIRFKDEFTATISMVDEAPEIYTGISAARGVAEGLASVSGIASANIAAAVGAAAGSGEAGAVADPLGTVSSVGAAAGIGAASGVGSSSGTAARAGSASGVGSAAAVGSVTGIASTVGAASGSGSAAAVGESVNAWGAGAAAGVGTATGVSSDPVPSAVPIWKGLFSDTANKSSGQSYAFDDVDVGTAHANRLVIIGTAGNSYIAIGAPTINGVAMDLVAGPGAGDFTLWQKVVASGTTADFSIPAGFTGALRCIIGVWVAYPNSSTKVDSGHTQATSTTNAVVSDVEVVDDGFQIAWGGQLATVGSFTGTWNGADTPTEDTDQTIESGTSVAAWSMPTTENLTTGDFTMAASASGTKRVVVASWGPPPT